MALGALKMSKFGIISRQPQVIENLGAISVLCLDKTGTITENNMELKFLFDYDSQKLLDIAKIDEWKNNKTLFHAVLASELNPFDTMEKAILSAGKITGNNRPADARMIHEYPLEGRPPMMTHIHRINDKVIVSAKGAAERIVSLCSLDDEVIGY
jgi:Ca2+-transporting ATPase